MHVKQEHGVIEYVLSSTNVVNITKKAVLM